MRRSNTGLMDIYGAKEQALNGYSYIITIYWRENKHVYLVKREGQRSWGAFALTDIGDEETHIKGNSINILEKVISLNVISNGLWQAYGIPNSDKTLLRKAIMEVITYGTVSENPFIIEKA